MGDPTTITVGFSRPRGWFEPLSWLIRLVDGTPFSHTYIRLPALLAGRDIVLEAGGSRVHLEGADRWGEDEVEVYSLPVDLSDGKYRELLSFAVDTIQAPYSVIELVGLALARVLHLQSNPFRAGKSSYICSSLVVRALDLPLDADNTHPRDVYQYLVTRNTEKGNT